MRWPEVSFSPASLCIVILRFPVEVALIGPESLPMKILQDPVVIVLPDPHPSITLKRPVVTEQPVLLPIKTFL